MGDKSSIEWTEATWNPATSCTKVSPGCDHCYMFRQYPRLNAMGVKGYEAGPESVSFIYDRLGQPARWKKPRVIFVNSMSDTFHNKLSDDEIALMFDAMREAPQHTYQVLTKRSNRVRRWWEFYRDDWSREPDLQWPENIWLGTSVESAKYLPRIERIAGIAPITFLSAEPLLGPLVFPWGMGQGDQDRDLCEYLDVLQWVIVGGESGPAARPMERMWVDEIHARCQIYGVPFFFKQWGGLRPSSNGRLLNGRTYDEMPETEGSKR